MRRRRAQADAYECPEAVGTASSAGVSGVTAADTGEELASWDSEEEEEPDGPLDRALCAPGLRGVDAAAFFESLSVGQVDRGMYLL